MSGYDWVKVVLSIMLLLCLLSMPYGYYTLIKYVGMAGFGILCYHYCEKRLFPMAIVFGVLVLLFQPFEKMALDRHIWNFLDALISNFLIILLFVKPEDQKAPSEEKSVEIKD